MLIEGRCRILIVLLISVFFLELPLLCKKNSRSSEADSREYKILLAAKNFSDPSSGVQSYVQLLIETAGELDIPFSAGPGRSPDYTREVLFYDTRDFELYKNGYILRQRYRRSDKKYDLVLKFRSDSLHEAQQAEVYAGAEYKDDIELQEDIIPAGHNSGLISKFSLSNKLKTSLGHVEQSISGLSSVFPPLMKLGIPEKTKLEIVNGRRIIEKKYSPGLLSISDKTDLEAVLSVWFLNGKVLVAEFSFTAPIKSDKFNKKVRDFFLAMNRKSAAWKQTGATKTSLIYKP